MTTADSSKRNRLGLRAMGGAGFGQLPGISPGVALYASLQLRAFRIELGGQYYSGGEARYANLPSVGATLELASAAARACLTPGSGRWSFPVCAGFEIGVIRGEGFGVAATSRDSSLWGAVVVGPALRFSLSQNLGLWVGADAVLPVLRPGFPSKRARGKSASTGAPEATGGTAPVPPPMPPAEPPLIFLTLTLRDFKRHDAADPTTNPGFGNGDSERSVVGPLLGDDGKPVYQPPAASLRTYGQAFFDQWYRDVPGTNYAVVYPLPVVLASDGTFEYDSQKTGTPEVHQGMDRRVFFPFDDGTPYATPFGNQGDRHNKLFTAELRAVFTLEGAGSTFQARGDDDIYVFIDGQLIIDLGGTHAVKGSKINIDDLGLTVGQQYALDLFYAERLGATGDLLVKTDLKLTSRLD